MAREIVSRMVIVGALRAVTPLHVGGRGDDVDVDLPLARNGRGEWYVPGTSLAGPLRHWCERAFGADETKVVWGFQDEREPDNGHASYVVVKDAPIPDALVEIRDGVGIDREWGSAAEHIKFERAILPRGATLTLSLIVEIPTEADRPRAIGMFVAIADALAEGEIRLGGAKTRGLGRLKLDNVHWIEERFDSRSEILRRVRRQPGQPILDVDLAAARSAFPPRPRPRFDVTISWAPRGPFMVKASYEGVGIDMVPLVSQVGRKLSLVLPGSSIKGALRAQAERIVRIVVPEIKLANDRGTRTAGSMKRFLDDLEVPLVDSMFGARGLSKMEERSERRPKKRDAVACDLPHHSPRKGLGALTIDDCYAAENMHLDVSTWERIVAASADLPQNPPDTHMAVVNELHNARLSAWTPAFHVAVDRWTGGAADQFLFSVLEPHAVEWEPMRLRVDLGRLTATERLPAIALLLLVMRDLARNRVPLGFATNRGMGEVEIERVEFLPRDFGADMAWLANHVTGADDPTEVLPSRVVTMLNRAWQDWIAQTTLHLKCTQEAAQ
jgi:CRISPR/Cas system CSM-associated protein Csm3 (group 7 of RAMP superfamily)